MGAGPPRPLTYWSWGALWFEIRVDSDIITLITEVERRECAQNLGRMVYYNTIELVVSCFHKWVLFKANEGSLCGSCGTGEAQ